MVVSAPKLRVHGLAADASHLLLCLYGLRVALFWFRCLLIGGEKLRAQGY